jgi:hypothetical protein
MNWEAIGSIGEIVGAIAVLASLAYLATQIRANTKSMETSSRQAVSNEFRAYNRFLSDDPEHFVKGINSYPEIPFETRSKFASQIHDLLLFFQSAFALYESGTLEDQTYDGYLSFVAAVVDTPGGRALWREWASVYTSGMVRALDSRISEGSLPDIRSFAQFNFEWEQRNGIPVDD